MQSDSAPDSSEGFSSSPHTLLKHYPLNTSPGRVKVIRTSLNLRGKSQHILVSWRHVVTLHSQKFTILHSNDMHIPLVELSAGVPSKTVATFTTAVLEAYLQVYPILSSHVEGRLVYLNS